jgi:hypothetical protein
MDSRLRISHLVHSVLFPVLVLKCRKILVERFRTSFFTSHDALPYLLFQLEPNDIILIFFDTSSMNCEMFSSLSTNIFLSTIFISFQMILKFFSKYIKITILLRCFSTNKSLRLPLYEIPSHKGHFGYV